MNEYQKGNRCEKCFFFKYTIIGASNGFWETTDYKCSYHKKEAVITRPTEQCCDYFSSKKTHKSLACVMNLTFKTLKGVKCI